MFWSVAQPAGAKELGGMFGVEEQPIEIVSHQSYSGLSELVSMICDDAIDRFQGFYGSTVVNVSPFASSSSIKNAKVSRLGVTLADQMIAMVNNDTLVMGNSAGQDGKTYEQNLSGVLQEIDGYLRVHMSGRNVVGKRFSYVANI